MELKLDKAKHSFGKLNYDDIYAQLHHLDYGMRFVAHLGARQVAFFREISTSKHKRSMQRMQQTIYHPLTSLKQMILLELHCPGEGYQKLCQVTPHLYLETDMVDMVWGQRGGRGGLSSVKS